MRTGEVPRCTLQPLWGQGPELSPEEGGQHSRPPSPGRGRKDAPEHRVHQDRRGWRVPPTLELRGACMTLNAFVRVRSVRWPSRAQQHACIACAYATCHPRRWTRYQRIDLGPARACFAALGESACGPGIERVVCAAAAKWHVLCRCDPPMRAHAVPRARCTFSVGDGVVMPRVRCRTLAS